MKLEETNLEKLLPLFMRQDPANCAIAEVASEVLQTISSDIAKLSTWDALGLLSNEELDALADELRVLWYDQTMPLESKRSILLHSDKIYMRMGTVKSLSDAVRDIFGAARIEQFYEINGGTPHYFRIAVDDAEQLTSVNEAKLMSLINTVKRKSQWLEKVYAQTIAKVPLNLGMTISISTCTRFRIEYTSDWQDEVSIEAFIGTTTEKEKKENTTITE